MRSDLPARTRRFALDVIRLCSQLPRRAEYQVIGRQLLRSATSVGANYRAVCRARSRADFIAKLAIVEEEADESAYWMELLNELPHGQTPELERLRNEAGQLVAITVASRKTAKRRQ
jgi:four helix bundle protein